VISYRDTDFDDGGFGGPAEPYYGGDHYFLFSPHLWSLLIAVAVILGCLMAVAYYAGRRRARQRLAESRRESVGFIYDSIKYKLERALQAPGYAVLERGRQVAEELESRLGLVLVLNDKPAKLMKDVKDALKREKAKTSNVPKPAKVKVPLPTDDHLARVWSALHAFHVFWIKDNGAVVKGLIEAAQIELSTAPVVEPEKARAPADSWWPFRRPAAVVAAALNDADKAGSAPIIVPPPAAEAPPEPDPTPPPPPPKRDKSKLPAHKRNMLA